MREVTRCAWGRLASDSNPVLRDRGHEMTFHTQVALLKLGPGSEIMYPGRCIGGGERIEQPPRGEDALVRLDSRFSDWEDR